MDRTLKRRSTLRRPNTEIPLVVFGCVHIGAETADLGMAKRYVDFVRRRKGYALLLGDNFECAVPSKGHMMMEQVMTPQKQLDYGKQLFEPIEGRIVGACTSNHSARAYKAAGLDMDKIMADYLGYAHRYYPHQGFIVVKVGSVSYAIAFKHGTGTGSNTFGNCLGLMRAFPNADICCGSHTHEKAATCRGFWKMEHQHRVVHPVTLVNTGSLLNYPRYADEAGYQPQPKGFPILWLNSAKKNVRVDLSPL